MLEPIAEGGYATMGGKGASLISYIGNVVTGRYRHWNVEHVPVLRLLVQRVGELPTAERSVFVSLVSAANLLVGYLLGPDTGKSRILRADARRLDQSKFFSLYFDLTAALLVVFVRSGRLIKADQVELENAFSHVFRRSPRGDEGYCLFSEIFLNEGRSGALGYLFRRIKQTVNEPPPLTPSDLGRQLMFSAAMNSGIESMLELMLLNLDEGRPR